MNEDVFSGRLFIVFLKNLYCIVKYSCICIRKDIYVFINEYKFFLYGYM